MHKKYFIAIVPPENILQKIEEIKLELYNKHGLKGALRSPAHITLHRPFEWKEEKESKLIEQLLLFKFDSPFNIELKNYTHFESRVIYIDVIKNETLFILHKQLMNYVVKQLKLFNEAEDERGFHPHVTIAFRDLKRQKFFELWNEFQNKSFSGSFNFNGFYLLKLESKWEILEKFTI